MNWAILALATLATGLALMAFCFGREAARREDAFAARGADFCALEARTKARRWGRVFIASWIAAAVLATLSIIYA